MIQEAVGRNKNPTRFYLDRRKTVFLFGWSDTGKYFVKSPSVEMLKNVWGMV